MKQTPRSAIFIAFNRLTAALIIGGVLAGVATPASTPHGPLVPSSPIEASRSSAPAQPLATTAKPQAAPITTDSVATQPTAELAPVAAPLALAPGRSYINYPYRALALPNDPLVASQEYLPRMQAPAAWDRATGNGQVTIAIIDTGFALEHQDLTGRWSANAGEMGPTTVEGPAPNCTSRGYVLDKRCNNIDNDGDGYASNWRGWDFVAGDNAPQAGSVATTSSTTHGTVVAGLAGAEGNNGLGITGITWNARLMPLQALADNGSGYTQAVAEAVRYAADHDADIINLSLGSDYDDPYLRAQISYAMARGVIVVAAAGNDGCDCIVYPANYPEVVAVGSTDASGNRAAFSNYGANLDLVAPGAGGICSTVWTSTNPTSHYSCGWQGTSFSAPLVAGAFSLLLAHRQTHSPPASPAAVRGFGQLHTPQYGYGSLDAARLLRSVSTPTALAPLAGKEAAGPVSLAGSPGIVTVCEAGGSPTCALRLTNTATGVTITTAPQPVADWGSSVYFWQPAAQGLTPGIWRVEYVTAAGNVVPMPAALLEITP